MTLTSTMGTVVPLAVAFIQIGTLSSIEFSRAKDSQWCLSPIDAQVFFVVPMDVSQVFTVSEFNVQLKGDSFGFFLTVQYLRDQALRLENCWKKALAAQRVWELLVWLKSPQCHLSDVASLKMLLL